MEAAYHAVAVDERRVAYVPTLWDPLPQGSAQVLEQVFFPGVHSDIGGGYRDDARLGDITLEWMACYGTLHDPMKYLPIRRAPREIRHGSISTAVSRRWKAPERAFVPYPYVTSNLTQEAMVPWMDWPEP